MTKLRVGFFGLLLLTSVLFSSCTNEAAPTSDPKTEHWISLFNGTDLADWDVKLTGHEPGDNFGETFRVTDGVIDVNYDSYDLFEGRFGVLVYRQPFSYYRLAVEYRFTGNQLEDGPGWAYRNSGLMLHSQSVVSMLKDQDFPVAIEVQLLGGNGTDDRTTLNLCTPGTNVVMDGELVTRHCVNSSSATYHGDDWVSAEIEVLGPDAFIHRIDGHVVLQYGSPQAGGGNVSNADTTLYLDGQLLDSGYIGLQSESHPVQFRNVRLLNLKGCMDPESPNYKSYFVEDNPADCQQ
jgi:3-keto-disaccharide hydrolase